MENTLGKFQMDLGQVSQEIKQLQNQSQTMSIKLRNRRNAEEQIGGIVDKMAVPLEMINSIIYSEVIY